MHSNFLNILQDTQAEVLDMFSFFLFPLLMLELTLISEYLSSDPVAKMKLL